MDQQGLSRRGAMAAGLAAAALSAAPRVAAQAASGYRLIAGDLLYPECPIAMPDGSILLVEIARESLTRILPDGSRTIVAQLGGGPNGLALGPDGAAYVANNGGLTFRRIDGNLRVVGVPDSYAGGSIQRVDLGSGKVTTLYTHAGTTA